MKKYIVLSFILKSFCEVPVNLPIRLELTTVEIFVENLLGKVKSIPAIPIPPPPPAPPAPPANQVPTNLPPFLRDIQNRKRDNEVLSISDIHSKLGSLERSIKFEISKDQPIESFNKTLAIYIEQLNSLSSQSNNDAISSQKIKNLLEMSNFLQKALDRYSKEAGYDAYNKYLEDYKENFSKLVFVPSSSNTLGNGKLRELDSVTQNFASAIYRDTSINNEIRDAMLARVNSVRKFFLLDSAKSPVVSKFDNPASSGAPGGKGELLSQIQQGLKLKPTRKSETKEEINFKKMQPDEAVKLLNGYNEDLLNTLNVQQVVDIYKLFDDDADQKQLTSHIRASLNALLKKYKNDKTLVPMLQAALKPLQPFETDEW